MLTQGVTILFQTLTCDQLLLNQGRWEFLLIAWVAVMVWAFACFFQSWIHWLSISTFLTILSEQLFSLTVAKVKCSKTSMKNAGAQLSNLKTKILGAPSFSDCSYESSGFHQLSYFSVIRGSIVQAYAGRKNCYLRLPHVLVLVNACWLLKQNPAFCPVPTVLQS